MNASTIARSPVRKWEQYAPGIAMTIVALAVAAPALSVILSLLTPSGDAIEHVLRTRAGQYASGTVWLCLMAGAGAIVMGLGSAMLIALTDFPMRRILSVALALPLAVPAYIAAYAYADLLGPFGSVATMLEQFFGETIATSIPEIRNLPGAAFVLSATLYPYVYLAARASFMARSAAMMEAARVLGAPPAMAMMRLLIPVARPAIAGGVALVMMETAADFGVADYYGVPTLSTGIFRTWYGLGDLNAAAQLAALLFFVALFLVLLEEMGRRGRTSDAARVYRGSTRMKLAGPTAAIAFIICAVPAALGFLFPVITLLSKVGGAEISHAAHGIIAAGGNSALVAGLGALIVVCLSAAMAYAARLIPHPIVRASVRAATLGYAVPGAVIAIGILGLLAATGKLTGANAAMVTGIPALLYAYTSRFMTIGYNSISAGLSQIDPSFDAAARTLGATTNDILRRVHLPLLKGSIAAAAIVVFIDITKELPATLILRSFNFETLATKVYRLAGDERLAEAAPDALMLILLGLAPILILNRLGEKH